jgi:6-pyruvoyltetrahydropterin/6-carboxytetrahydropterin synthase
MFTATRYHDISCGHRVVGHESKCANLHGHNYRIYFTCAAYGLDYLGRVIDFSVIKNKLCEWLEREWDHRFIIWEYDPHREAMQAIDNTVVIVPFNPTAENIAAYLVDVIAPSLLKNMGAKLISCVVEETRKCKATYSIP